MQNCISTESFGKIHNEIKRFSGCALQILYRISFPPLKMWSKTLKPLIYKGKKANFKFALGVCQSKELMIF